MKTTIRILKEAVDICHDSRLYPYLSRREKREAVIYCQKIVGKIREKGCRDI